MLKDAVVHLINRETRKLYCGVKPVVNGESCYKNFVGEVKWVTCKRCMASHRRRTASVA